MDVENDGFAGRCLFDTLPDRFQLPGRADHARRQVDIRAKDSQQQMFGFDLRAAELAGRIPGEEDRLGGPSPCTVRTWL